MCNEKLNLVKLLSGCPKGTKLYSPIVGEAAFLGINIRENYPMRLVIYGMISKKG